MGKTFYFDWEMSLIKWLQTNLSSFVDFGEYFVKLGSELIPICVIAYVYLVYDKKIGRKIMINTIVGLCFACGLKNIFKRRRPYFDNDEIKCLIPVDSNYDVYDVSGQGYSFPSLHSFNVTCISFSLYKYLKKNYILILSILISFLVGLSRIITANHFPSDVIMGWIIGIVSIIVVDYLQEKIEKKKLYLSLSIFFLLFYIFCRSNDFYSSYGIMVGFFLADLYDDKYVKFENTKNYIRGLLRIIIAGIIFLIISGIIKLLLLSNLPMMFDYLFRTLRYGLSIFISLGIYPRIFKRNIFKFKK